MLEIIPKRAARTAAGLLVRQSERDRVPPAEIADAVELWARKSGRHATLKWIPEAGCWSINLTLRPDDPTLRLYQEGKVAEPPTEGVLLHEWDEATRRYRALDLEEWGPSGIVGMLERGDTWSGRGEYNSLAEGVQAAILRQREEQEKMRRQLRQDAQDRFVAARRQILGIPLIQAGIDLRGET